MILHIALLRFRSDQTPESLRSFSQFVAETCRQIPTVQRAYVGPRATIDAGYPSQFGESTYDAAAMLQFDDAEGLVAYLRHPLHRELGRRFWEISQSVLIFETEVVDAKSEGVPEDWFSRLERRT